MNGQSYDTVVPKSMNGTTPTPTSNSYPGSLSSSHSSRDGSPSRLISNNYINSGANHITGQQGQYKNNSADQQNTGQQPQYNNTHIDYTQTGDGYRTGPYQPNIGGQVAKNQVKVANSQSNYNSSRPNPPLNPIQNSSPYQKTEVEDPVYSNIGPGLVSGYQKKPPTPIFNYHDQKSDNPPQEVGYTGEAPKTPTSNNYPVQTYAGQNYLNQQQAVQQQQQPTPTQTQPKHRDQPITSGPPRTNVLGIIPYNTEGVTSMARSGVSTGVSSSQTPTSSNNVNSYSNSSPASYTNSQQMSQPQAPFLVRPQAQPYMAQQTTYAPQQTYPQRQPYNSQQQQQQQQQPQNQPTYPQQSYNQPQQPYNSSQQMYNSQQSYPAIHSNPPQPHQNFPPYSMPPQTQYTQQSSYHAQAGYYQQNSAYPTSPPTSGGYQQPATYQSYPSQPSFPSQPSYPRVSTTSVSPLRPTFQQGGNIGYPQGGGHYRNDDLSQQMADMSVTQTGYNHIWGRECIDLLKTKDILPTTKVEPPPIRLQQDCLESNNCSPDLFRCTLTKIPETKSLLDKSRLPLGVLIHPFKDLNQLSVIQCTVIVRCKSCRSYINPFVYFVDAKHWKCNLCYRVNELPEEFQYDPLSKTYGDPTRRPEIKSATIEFIAPSEYMVRPPQPAAYVFVLDVSRSACESGYLQVVCDTLLDQLEALPGDARTAIAFITYDSSVHYYSLAESQSQPHQMIVVDVDDMFVPSPDNLLVNLNECLFLVKDLLKELPNKYRESYDTGSALGAALQAAFKLLAPTGGRVTVMTCSLVNGGPGLLTSREDPSQRSGENITQQLLNPVTDFYKKIALDCSGQQIAVDLFILNSMFVDLATISGISRFSGGCMHHFPLFNIKNPHMVEMFHRSLHRYLCRKIGFESVMRLRCTRGLSIHTFHGNFFVRSTDLLSLPNINPDAGFGMQVSIDENLTDSHNVCFQAALLYTSSKGERRIRVHTLCLPIASTISDVLHGADQQCIIGLLAKMAVDRCHQSSLSDAREAFVNVVSDVLSVYRASQSSNSPSSLLAPCNLSLLPLYILALLKHTAFRIGQSTRLDDRVYSMCQMKTLSLSQLIQSIYPDLYPVHNLHEYPVIRVGDEDVVQPPRMHLSAERIDCTGIYLLDDGESILVYVGHNVPPQLIKAIFDVPSFASIDPNMGDLPKVNTPESEMLRGFINYLQNEKSVPPVVQVIRNDSSQRQKFLERLIEDKNESGHSYYEFLQNIKVFVK